jgi:carboxypeptidase Taq
MPSFGDRVDALKHLMGEVIALRHAADLIEWDERVCMPIGGAEVHGDMQATLRRLAHEKFTSEEIGGAIEDLQRDIRDADPDSDIYRLVTVTARDYEKATRVPPSFVAEHALAISAAQHAWIQARAESAFSIFQPHLQRIVELKKQYVTFFPGAEHPYDVLVDEFEPGMTTREIKAIFDVLRPRQVALLRAIASRPQVADDCLRTRYAEADLLAFAVEVVTAFGFDWTRGRQDKSVHPFATAIGGDDVRITTRFVESHPMSLLFGTMHETGHALYEQGVSPAHRSTLLEGGTSLGLHESQSRLWENLIGRSRPFWEHFFPILRDRFPAQLGDVDLEQFYKAINRVTPSPIRVEADEATYNLHVMLRVDLEIGLIDGSIPVADVPALWNARMQEYLGITPANDAAGVLQDVHWSAGLIGYFGTYTLGNLIAAQIWDAFTRRHPSFDDDMRRGNFAPLLTWLRSELHAHGRKYEPQELVERTTGSRVDPEPYLRYLEKKYAEVYGNIDL